MGRQEDGGTLVSRVSDAIRAQIRAGAYAPGARLPSEAQLTALHGVSRTVVREAIAALRADGLVQPRQGAGVFVLETQVEAPPAAIDRASVASIIEVLEIRTGIEVEAAGLAAQRRSPAQEEAILRAHAMVGRLAAAGEPTGPADFALHLAIAEAANNPRFRQFLDFFGEAILSRSAVTGVELRRDPAYMAQIDAEHARIVAAISDGEVQAAREAMRLHLRGGQARYRALLRATRQG